MEKLMLISFGLLALNILLSPFLKHKNGVLFCGLFGFSGHDKANDAKIKILGIYNKSRGRDSCGYFLNGTIVKSAEVLQKEFPDFIEKNVIDFKGDSRLFIGHTRQGTFGAKTKENAHPFNINDRLVIAHNGTLDNVWELCEKYEIDTTKVDVDSEALGLLIDKVGLSILTEYRGYAALLFNFYNQPDTLYVYHGASKLYKHAQALTEERPMFFMKTAEGMYFSSMHNSLMAIRSNIREVPVELPHNKVFKFTKGTMGAKPFEVYREFNNLDLEKKTTYHYPTTSITQGTPMGGFSNKIGGLTSTQQKALPFTSETIIVNNFQKVNINTESYPLRNFLPDFISQEKNYLFSHMGRHLSIDDYSYAEGIVYCDKDGFIYEEEAENIKPYYFHEGIMLKDKKAWLALNAHIEAKDHEGLMLSLNKTDYNFALNISEYAKFPVCNLDDEGAAVSETLRKMWWLDKSAVSGGYKPYFSERNYVYKIGDLMDIKSTEQNDKIFFKSYETQWVNSYSEKEDLEQDSYTILDEEVYDKKKVDVNAIKDGKPFETLVKDFDKIYSTEYELWNKCDSSCLKAIDVAIEKYLLLQNIQPMPYVCEGRRNSIVQHVVVTKKTLRQVITQMFGDDPIDLNRILVDVILKKNLEDALETKEVLVIDEFQKKSQWVN